MLRRTASLLLLLHVALIAFSTVAMVTVLAAPTGRWLAEEPAATVMRLSFRFAGPAYVTLGALAALVFLASRIGWTRATALAVVSSAISLGVEILGTSSGLPFGDYAYSAMLGYRIMGLVPFPIPISWFYMLVGALAIVARLRPATGRPRERRAWALYAALLLVAWDVAMDPAMVATGHWRWGPGEMFRGDTLPGWVVAFFTGDAFYGMPLANWFGWLLTAAVIARVMLSVVAPREYAERVGASSFPIVLYLSNGVMPVALCLREGFWWAAVIGVAGMAAPATLALRRSPSAAPADPA